jgi:hypothetical protein
MPDSNQIPPFQRVLSWLMTQKKFNNNQLAKVIGVAPITVARWLASDCSNIQPVKHPRCENVEVIAKALKLNSNEQYYLFMSAGCRPPVVPNRILPLMSPFSPSTAEESQWAVEDDKSLEPEVLNSITVNKPIPGIAIYHPRQLFGREEILRRICRAWSQSAPRLQHVAIIGPRRSGKTSLLKYLQHIGQTPTAQLRPDQPQGWGTWLPHDFQFAFVDFQQVVMSHPETLLKEILKQLHLKIPTSCDLISFSMALYEQLEKPTVILMDEVGSGLQAPELDAIFWSNMRALGNNCANGKLGLVVSAHEPLEILAKDSGKESPFFNIFGHAIHLKPLEKHEAEQLISSFNLSLTEVDNQWLLQESCGWPALLQLLCDARLTALEIGDTSDKWKQEGLERIKPFLYLKKNCLKTDEIPPYLRKD